MARTRRKSPSRPSTRKAYPRNPLADSRSWPCSRVSRTSATGTCGKQIGPDHVGGHRQRLVQPRRCPDPRVGRRRQADQLGVAAALQLHLQRPQLGVQLVRGHRRRQRQAQQLQAVQGQLQAGRVVQPGDAGGGPQLVQLRPLQGRGHVLQGLVEQPRARLGRAQHRGGGHRVPIQREPQALSGARSRPPRPRAAPPARSPAAPARAPAPATAGPAGPPASSAGPAGCARPRPSAARAPGSSARRRRWCRWDRAAPGPAAGGRCAGGSAAARPRTAAGRRRSATQSCANCTRSSAPAVARGGVAADRPPPAPPRSPAPAPPAPAPGPDRQRPPAPAAAPPARSRRTAPAPAGPASGSRFTAAIIRSARSSLARSRSIAGRSQRQRGGPSAGCSGASSLRCCNAAQQLSQGQRVAAGLSQQHRRQRPGRLRPTAERSRPETPPRRRRSAAPSASRVTGTPRACRPSSQRDSG